MPEKPTYSVNIDCPIAVYVQIENQIQFAIASGSYQPGDALPSVREMSTMLNINPNTVTKAYRDLELLRLVCPRRGVGVTVSQEAPKICRETTLPMAIQHLRDAVAECTMSGLAASAIRKLVSETIEQKVKPYQTAP